MYRTYGNCNIFSIPPPIAAPEDSLCIQEMQYKNIRDPRVWGSAMWFSLFCGSCSADEKISRCDRAKYWKFIEGLPIMLPCLKCREHAKVFIDKHRAKKEEICSTRQNLIKFFVEFHNSVSKRKGQKDITMEEIKDRFLSDKPVNAMKIKYV